MPKLTVPISPVKPRQAEPDDPRWKGIFERARADADYLEMILAMEANLDALKIKEHTTRIDQLEQQHHNALGLPNPLRHVKLREVNGKLIEHWREIRGIAKIGGAFKLRYGTLRTKTLIGGQP